MATRQRRKHAFLDCVPRAEQNPSLNQRATHREVLITHKLARLAIDSSKESLCDFGVPQTVTMLQRDRVLPDRADHAKTCEPAKQELVVDLRNQHLLGTLGEKNRSRSGSRDAGFSCRAVASVRSSAASALHLVDEEAVNIPP